MSDILERDLISYDPLTEVTRKERRALLGTSMLGLALAKVPLIPTKLVALGIEFSEVNRQTFVQLYGLIVLYYLVAFLVYAFTDLVAWRRSEHIRYSAYLKAEQANQPSARKSAYAAKPETPQPFAGKKPVYRRLAAYGVGVVASRLRAAFEFGFPILFAAVALYALYTFTS